MAVNIEQLHEQYQQNAYTGMVADLSAQLGVSVESLQRLELGWAPVVTFKKGPNYQGWWTIPERNQHGEIVGLSLRSQSNQKVMYPGSNHGLIYAVNPDHTRGSVAYKHGAHNWVRTMDISTDCPVCGKPDGCLLAADNPERPRAVICIRVEKGAKRQTDFGYLHILKKEGHITQQAGILPASDLPVVIVEGMTDAAAAMDLGFIAVGRPSNIACMGMLSALLKGRKAVIIGENDHKPDGSCPGEQGMIAAYQILKSVCPVAHKLMPPEEMKDLRHWKNEGDLTAEKLVEYISKFGEEQSEVLILPDNRPQTIARQFLMDQYRQYGRYTVRCLNKSWYQYVDGRYEFRDDNELTNPLYNWAENRSIQNMSKSGDMNITPIHVDNRFIQNTQRAMEAEAAIIGHNAPCWINGVTGADPKEYIVFSNGQLHIPSYLRGDDLENCLVPLTPDFFTLTALPYPFDPTAEYPNFLKWVESSLGDDPDKIRLIQEFMGYCMTCDTSLHKMLWMAGVTGGGKSIFSSAVRTLVGKKQHAALDLDTLTSTFGMGDLEGTLVATMADFRLPKYGNTTGALKRLLNIVGEDSVTINRKYKDAQKDRKLTCKIIVSSNDMPQFNDASGALKRRLLIVEFARSFVGREDTTLRDKFKAEAPGIALWALEGLRCLREQRDFTVPESMRVSLEDWHKDNNPVTTFIEECVRCNPSGVLEHKNLFAAFRLWADEHGEDGMGMKLFKQAVLQRTPSDVRSVTTVIRGRKVRAYIGLELTNWAESEYLGKPANQRN
ncbi:hypothetical protein LCGC14_1462330 [marine sediment metagenome]|uniref:SF3 helicase domain-containing protein n=1 Tax=marine sediment metagenome TaxID=412755 RepID=A0A0F9MGS8_9ZZZZ